MSEHEPEHEDEASRAVDRALKPIYAPDAAALAAIVARVERAAAGPRRFPWLRVASLLLVVLGVTLGAWWIATRGDGGGDVARRWANTYRDAVAHGYPSPGCCRPGIDLAGHCRSEFSCALQMCPSPGDVELMGLYCGAMCEKDGKDPTVLLLRAGAQPVCVFVERLAEDPRPATGAHGDLFVHRRPLPPLVLYEVSRTKAPATLEKFVLPP